MTKIEHTPGPWYANRPGMFTTYIEASLGGGIIQEVAAVGPTAAPEQAEANAKLIAEAPAMFAELQAIAARNKLINYMRIDAIIERVAGVL